MIEGRPDPLELEHLFGDPNATVGEFTHSTIVTADTARRMVPWAERVLEDWGFGAELVPRRLGGRWGSTEDLVRRFLPIFRRDPALGLGHGITTLMAAVNVWVAGDDAAQRKLADRLFLGERVAVCFHELEHGNDLLMNECTAVRVEEPGQGWRINGRKEVINNIHRAESALLFVRTARDIGPRSFSLLLWNKTETVSGAADTSRRVLTSGMRGCNIGVASFHDLVVSESSLIGSEGQGTATALAAFQVTRAVIPALATGTVDAALRLAVPYMRGRALYGATVWDLPHARLTLVRAWSSLLIADALARAGVRALHIRPDECFLISAATKYIVPVLLNDAMQELSVLLGSSFYAVTSPFGIVEKWLRDLIVVPIGHAGSSACLATLIPNLPAWARRVRRPAPYESGLFAAESELDDIVFSGFGLGAGRVDSMTASLRSGEIATAFQTAHPALAPLIDRWRDELVSLRDAAAALSPSSLGADAPPEVFTLARRLARLMAAGALLGTWYEGRTERDSPFRRSESAITMALQRLDELLDPREHGAPPGAVAGIPPWADDDVDAAANAIAAAVDAALSLGVEERPVVWSPPVQPEVIK
ncbi:acyl-CoA dehydrogenase [Cryobacterium sp. TMT1-66-1]|uniref:acyl-CoA dehydrogenase n=1 Tax=Cryobacterium sp. TMT1-66-1 TaxID=1259242 RepID=UPI00141B5F55|nr:acyl-CoA dehydrogenase [Cryobacterium sp. TMT1-66-1]